MTYKQENYLVFPSPEALAAHTAEAFLQLARQSAANRRPGFVALSGGSTPNLLYRELTRRVAAEKPDWRWLHLFWGDERCVPPDDPESNFGTAERLFLKPAGFPKENIHRIRGEADPEEEAVRYQREITRWLPAAPSGLPRFDWVFLGMGADGHTASLFPGAAAVRENERLCVPAVHLQSGQRRITITLPLINTAAKVTFLVTGEFKRNTLRALWHNQPNAANYPAALVQPEAGQLEWWVDVAVNPTGK
ncbi:MAG: 6-phosphogluconolactonase [Calditrichia bacterium]